MNKSITLITILNLVTFTLFAQFTFLGESPKFDEPTKGFNQTVVMNDGTTCNLTIDKNFAIGIRTFDKDYKQIISKTVTARFGRLKLATELTALFEANDQIVLVITEYETSSMSAYRVVIDPKAGLLVKQDKVLNNEKKAVSLGNLAMARGGSVLPGFAMAADPKSQNYACGFVNTNESREKREFTVKLYNKNHEVINEFTLPWGAKNIYDHIRIDNMLVVGDKVYASLLAFNLNLMQEEKGTYIIVDCSEKGSHTEFAKVEENKDLDLSLARLNYNYNDNKVYLLAQYLLPRKLRKDEANAFESGNRIFIYDPKTKSIVNGKPVKAPGVDNFDKSLERFYFNADGSYSLVYELYESNTAVAPTGGGGTSSRTTLEFGSNVVINDNGMRAPSVVKVPKNHFIRHANSSSSFSGRLEYDEDLAYKRYFYVNGPKNSYLVINDEYENEKRVREGKKPSKVNKLNDCSAFYFDVSGAQATPQRNYLFEDKECIVMTSTSFYNPRNQIYATLKKDRKTDKVSMVWMKVNSNSREVQIFLPEIE